MKISSGINKVKNIICFLFGAVSLIAIVCFLALFIISPGRIKRIKDENGQIVKNSISEKRFAEINGVKMGMIIKSKDASNPVLLFVHGGPGMPEYFLTEDYPTGLDEYFTVVWWDQRSAGLSFIKEVVMKKALAEVKKENEDRLQGGLRERKIKDSIIFADLICSINIKDIEYKILLSKYFSVGYESTANIVDAILASAESGSKIQCLI